MKRAAWFMLLGPVVAYSDRQDVDLGRPKQRCVLAALLISANQPVPTATLISRAWGDDPPITVRNALYTYIAQLRAVLSPFGTRLVKKSSGYVMEADPENIDLHRFRRLTESARRGKSDVAAADLLNEAVRLCVGVPFGDLHTPWIDGMRAGLLAECRSALLQRNEVLLRLGLNSEILAELREATAASPLDESLARQLMVALYRSGQQAAALRHYHTVREILAGELGVDPGTELQALYQQVLRGESALFEYPLPAQAQHGRALRPGDVPAQLPHDVAAFIGREREFTELRSVLPAKGAHPDSRPPRICVIDGAPGTGKTTLAVHFAHQAANWFPDGQLYFDLRGHDPRRSPISPTDVLGQFLRALGVNAPGASTMLDELAARYRTQLAGRRMLIVLDNAVSSGQVRPLLPGHPGCLVLITSRNRLAGLIARDRADHLTLDALTPEEALDLLGRTIGMPWVSAEPEAAAQLARLCGYLPLALVIAAERATADPSLSSAELVSELTVERRRLARLTSSDDETTAVRAAFSWSYHGLSAPTARVFRLLGLHPSPDVGVPVAAALAGDTIAEAQRRLARLTQTHLVEASGQSRYHLHDLLHVYAAERAVDEETSATRQAAVQRMMIWYLHAAASAALVLLPNGCMVPLDPLPTGCPPPPAFGTRQQALQWCRAERASLTAVTRQAEEAGLQAIAWKLPVILSYFFYIDKVWNDWIATCKVGLAAARCQADVLGESWILTSLGVAYYDIHDFGQSIDHLERAVACWRLIRRPKEESLALCALGADHRALGRYDEAMACFRRALALSGEAGDQWSQGIALRGLGCLYQSRELFGHAADCFQGSLVMQRDMNDRYGEALTLHDIGTADAALGRFEESLACLREALTLRRALGDRHGTARTLRRFGSVLADSGRFREARASWQSALIIFEEVGDSRAAEVRKQLAALAD